MEMEMSLSDMVLDFLEELERGGEREKSNEWESGDDEDGLIGDAKQNKDFWQTQNQLLHVRCLLLFQILIFFVFHFVGECNYLVGSFFFW